MARIVSGVPQQEYDGFAVLRGFERGKKARIEQQELQDKQLMRMAQMQEIAFKFQKARAEREELVNKNAQMGDARALQEMYYRAKADPRQLMMEDANRLLAGITDPDARRVAAPAMEGLLTEYDRVQEFKSAAKMFGRAQKDVEGGIFTPEAVQAWGERLKSAYEGGDAAGPIMQEMQAERRKFLERQQVMEENQLGFQQAQAAHDALPPGYEKQRAGIALKYYTTSPAALEEKGAGSKALQAVQAAGLGSAKSYAEREMAERERREAQFTTAPMPGLGGTTGLQMRAQLEGNGVPKVGGDLSTIPGTHATVKGRVRGKGKTIDPRAATMEVIGSVKDDAELLQALKERGVRITESNVAAIKKAAEEWRGYASPGAER